MGGDDAPALRESNPGLHLPADPAGQGVAIEQGGGDGGVAFADYGTLVVLGAAIAAIGVFAPLHSRAGAIAVITARIGLVLALVPVAGALATDWSIWPPMLVVTLAVAAAGMACLVLARRDEGDIPGRLLELALAGTVVGVLFTRLGGCVVPGILWLAVAAALWSSYAAPSFSLAPSRAQ